MRQIFNIPEGCNQVIVEQINNSLVMTFVPDQMEFKLGDFLVNEYGDCKTVAIVHHREYIFGDNYYNYIAWFNGKDLVFGANCNSTNPPRYATTEERQLLLAKLEEDGYRYDEETHEIVQIRWLPKVGEFYAYLSSSGKICKDTWFGLELDQNRLSIGNCFNDNQQNSIVSDLYTTLGIVKCPNLCNGGKVKHYPDPTIALYDTVECPYCNGKGEVTEQQAMRINAML